MTFARFRREFVIKALPSYITDCRHDTGGTEGFSTIPYAARLDQSGACGTSLEIRQAKKARKERGDATQVTGYQDPRSFPRIDIALLTLLIFLASVLPAIGDDIDSDRAKERTAVESGDIAASPPLDPDDAKSSDVMRVRLWRSLTNANVYDRDAISGWCLLFPEVLNSPIDRVLLGNGQDQEFAERTLRVASTAILAFVLEEPLRATCHEYGHFRDYSLGGIEQPQFSNQPDRANRIDVSPFGAYTLMFDVHILDRNGVFADASEEDWERLEATDWYDDHFVDFWIQSSVGGLNQSQHINETHAQEVLEGRAHPIDAVFYYLTLLDTITYPQGQTGDPSGYVYRLGLNGIRTDETTVKVWTELPKLASNSSISLIRGVLRYWLQGVEEVKPITFRIRQIRAYWPEFASYKTSRGPTVKVTGRGDWQDHVFTISYERSFAATSSEVGVGWRGPLTDRLDATLTLYRNLEEGGTWFEVSSAVDIGLATVGVQGYGGQKYTFRGELIGHHFLFLQDSEIGAKAFIEFDLPR